MDSIFLSRISSLTFLNNLAGGYLAFEALCDHGYSVQSILHGNFPKVLSVDGWAQGATDDVYLPQFAEVRVERDLDADLQHQLLKLSMMSPMVFSERLRFIVEAAPTFGPFKRV